MGKTGLRNAEWNAESLYSHFTPGVAEYAKVLLKLEQCMETEAVHRQTGARVGNG